jgi:Ni,Fe-hydrogenase III component G
MNPQNYLERAEQALAPWMEHATHPRENRLDVTLPPKALLAAVSELMQDEWGYLAAITGLDPGLPSGELWVLYHFAGGPVVVTLRISLPRENPEVPTIREIVPLAGIYEQELHEVLGVTVIGLPDTGRLFLSDDWPEGIYPLRKEFQGL